MSVSRQSPRPPSLRPLGRGGRRQQLLSVIVLLLVVLIAFLVDWLLSDAPPAVEQIPPQQSSSALEIFFTTPNLVYPDVADQRTTPPFLQRLLGDIASAQSTIDVAVFEYNLLSVADALVAAQQRGVTVRLALDRESLEDPDDARFAGMLEDAGATISWQESDAFLHSKFVVIDQRLVWTGSWNATNNDTYRNNNNLLRLTVPELVADYANEFEQMAAGAFGNDKQATSPYGYVELEDGSRLWVYFTPRERPRSTLVDLIGSAEQEIRFLAFSFTSDEIGDAMVERSVAGVNVSGVFEKRNAGGQGSELENLRSGGVDVLEDGNCYTMHHKVMVIDRRFVVTGSYNFTERAESVNDENLLIIDSPAIAAQYLEEYGRVRRQAEQPQRCGS